MKSVRSLRLVTVALGIAWLLVACGVANEIDIDGADASSDASDGSDARVPTDGSDADAPMDALTDALHDAPTLDASRDATPDAAPPPPVTCRSPEVNCGGVCVNRQTDERNCGACGHACVSGAVCLNGECSLNATCPPVHYPSVTLQSVPSATMTSLYSSIASGSCFSVPHCFLDLNDLQDPDTGRSVSVHVNVSAHFELYEFVATEIAGGYTHFALVSPTLVQKMEQLRAAEGGNPLGIASGYRSPQHQIATCRSICPGGAMCCPTASHPCGCRSEHEWGRAADLSISSGEYTAYGNYAHSVHFPDCLLEVGSFHVDVSPCPLGCPYNF